jgi:hypothetical protein
MSQEIRRPVRLLRDDHGIYGIGSDPIVESETPRREIPLTLILRSDRWANVEVDDHLNHLSRHGWYPILQAITVGRWRGSRSSLEERLRCEVHHELLRRAGLVNESLSEEGFPQPRKKWWSSNRKQQDRNRRKFHGLKVTSVVIVNTLIRQALAEAADQSALKVARRFPFVYRYPIYRAAALSPRALQLAETFPVLAAALYSKGNAAPACLVEAGAPLHHVAEAAATCSPFAKTASASQRWNWCGGRLRFASANCEGRVTRKCLTRSSKLCGFGFASKSHVCHDQRKKIQRLLKLDSADAGINCKRKSNDRAHQTNALRHVS